MIALKREVRILTRSEFCEIEKQVQYIVKRTDLIQYLKYELQKIMINKEDMNTLSEWISFTDE